MTKTMKRLVSVILTLAMVITSVSYTPKTVSAAELSDTSVTFTISPENVTGNLLGFVFQGAYPNDNPPKFGITWDAGIGDANAEIKKDGTTVHNLGSKTKEAGLTFAELKELNLDEGDYTVVFTGTGNYATQSQTLQLTVTKTNAGGDEEQELTWQSSPTLTSMFGAEAKYAVKDWTPAGGDGHLEIQKEYLWWISGATKSTISVSLNGSEVGKSTDNSALGTSIKYSQLKAGQNIIEAIETNNEGTTYTYKFYINVPNQVLNASVNNYAKYTGKYVFKFDEVDDATAYKVYVDDNVTAVGTITGSGGYISGDLGLTAGDHNFYLTAVVKGEETVKSAAIPFTYSATVGNNTEIPQIYVQTDDLTKEAKSIVKTDKKLTSVITVVDKNGGTNADIINDTSKTTIKVRGNSTAGADKKAYNISFDKAKDVFGMGSAKKWSLLANAFDKSLIRNKLAMDLGQALGVPYTSNSTYVDLYLNGVYMGNYLLIESVEVGASRVDIKSEYKDYKDVLIELENNTKDEAEEGVRYITTTLNRVRFNIGSPENGDGKDGSGDGGKFTDAELATKDADALAILNTFETALSDIDNNYQTVANLIDVDSFVNFYILNEFFKNKDFNYSSTRFYIKDNKLYAGPPWDYDLSSGNWGGDGKKADDMYCQEMPWFKKLMQNETFKQAVADRYGAMRSTIQAVYKTNINALITANTASFNRNYTAIDAGGAGWSATEKDLADQWSLAATESKTYDDTITYLKKWFEDRDTYLAKEWLNDFTTDDVEEQIASSIYNLALNQPASTNYTKFGSAAEGDVSRLTDGSLNSGRVYPTDNEGGKWYQVDLGKYYTLETIEKIVSVYNETTDTTWPSGANGYKIQYSVDGTNFIDIKTAQPTQDNITNSLIDEQDVTLSADQIATLKSNGLEAVRYVRVYYSDAYQHGVQLKELAVIDTDKDKAEVTSNVPAPALENVKSEAEGEITGTIVANADATEGTTYLIFVDGVQVDTADTAGGFTLTGISGGNHTVTVKAFKGLPSAASGAMTVNVMAPAITLADMLVNRDGVLYNLAYQKTYTFNGATNNTTSAPGSGDKDGCTNSAEGTGSITNGTISDEDFVTPMKKQHGATDAWFTIDLGEEYVAEDIDSVYVWFRYRPEAGCGPQENGLWVQFSDDENFSNDAADDSIVAKVAQKDFDTKRNNWTTNCYPIVVTKDGEDAEGTLNAEKVGTVRYVRIYMPSGATYGAQVTEIAVFNNEGNARTGAFIPMTDAEIEADTTLAGAPTNGWVNIGTTGVYKYYDTEKDLDITDPQIQNGTVQSTTLDGTRMTIGCWLGADLTAKIGSTDVAKVENQPTVLLFDTDAFISTGIYKMVVTQNGTEHIVYIKKSDYSINGVVIDNNILRFEPTTDLIDMADDYRVYVTLDGEEQDSVSTEGILQYDLSKWGLAPGTYQIVVKAIKADGDGNETVIVTSNSIDYRVAGDEPDYYDLVLRNVEIEYTETVGAKATITATIYNAGKTFTLANGVGNLVMITLNSKTGAEVGYLGQHWEIITNNHTISGLEKNAANQYIFGNKETMTLTWSWNTGVQQTFIDTDDIKFLAKMEGTWGDKTDWDNTDKTPADNYFIWSKTGLVEPPKSVSAELANDKKTVNLSWVESDEAKAANEGTYKYNVYDADGNKLNDEPIDGTTFTKAYENALDGTYTYTVKTVRTSDGKESAGTSAKVFAYTIPAEWQTWAYPAGKSTDIYDNSWYYYNGYNWNTLNMAAGGEWGGLYDVAYGGAAITTGTFATAPVLEIPVIGEGDGSIQTVTINDGNTITTYTSDINGVFYGVADRAYLDQSLFALSNTEREKVFAITLSGKNDNSILVKVVNSSVADFDLQFDEEKGKDVASNYAVIGATKYKITYTVNDEDVVVNNWTESNYEFPTLPDNNTPVKIQAYDDEGNAVGEEMQVLALADLQFVKVTQPGAIIAGTDETVEITYKNAGTAALTWSGNDKYYAIKVDADVNAANGAYAQSTTLLAPGETETVYAPIGSSKMTVGNGGNTIEGQHNFTVILDEGAGRTVEYKPNNTQKIQIPVVAPNKVKLEYKEAGEHQGHKVIATWDEYAEAKSYFFVYETYNVNEEKIVEGYTDQVGIKVYNKDTAPSGLLEVPEEGKLSCGIGRAINNGSVFRVYANTDSGTVLIGAVKALADLKITAVGYPDYAKATTDKAKGYNARLGYDFSINVTVKNVGTAQILPCPPSIKAAFEKGDITSDEFTNKSYEYTIPVAVTWNDALNNDVTVENTNVHKWALNDGYIDGLIVGNDVTRKIEGVRPTVQGDAVTYTYWVDHYGNSVNNNVVEFHDELIEGDNSAKEDTDTYAGNNVLKVNYKIAEKEQTDMDWTALKSEGSTDDYFFDLAGGTKQTKIYYRVLATSITDKDYADIFSSTVGYSGMWMHMGMVDDKEDYNVYRKKIDGTGIEQRQVQAKDEEGNLLLEDDGETPIYVTEDYDTGFPLATYTYTLFAQVKDEYFDYWINQDIEELSERHGVTDFKAYTNGGTDSKDNVLTGTLGTLSTKADYVGIQNYEVRNYANKDIYPAEGSIIRTIGEGDSKEKYNGNGFDYFVNSWAPGKRYVMCAVDPTTGHFVIVGFKVGDEVNDWVQAEAKAEENTDPDKLDVLYHESNMLCGTTGGIFYDASVLDLANIRVYNGDHLAVTLDATKKLGFETNVSENWEMQIAYGAYDAATEKVTPVGAYDHATDTYAETPVFHRISDIGRDGTDTLQVKLPELFKDVPVHSDKSGAVDTEYYVIRVYYNTVGSTANEYVEIPVMVRADIPMIETAQGLTAQKTPDAADRTQLTITWSETTKQVSYDYTYKVFVTDSTGEKEMQIGATDGYTGAQTLIIDADTYAGHITSFKSTYENAEISQVKVVAYWCDQEIAVSEVISNPQGGWQDIAGQSTIEISAGQERTKAVALPGQIRYFNETTATGVANHVYSVAGYNGQYIAITANSVFFTKENTKISVTTDEAFDGEKTDGSELTSEQYNVLAYRDVEMYDDGSADGMIQILAKDLFTAKHVNSFYVVKFETEVEKDTNGIEAGTYTSYIKFHTIVEGGGAELKGFQMNTDSSEGAVSEFSPSFRVVSRAAKVVEVPKDGSVYTEFNADTEKDEEKANPEVHAVVKFGTLYGVGVSDMTFKVDENDKAVYDEETQRYTLNGNYYYYESTVDEGILKDWPASINDADKDNYTYYALTFKPTGYTLSFLDTEYALKSYAITETGAVVYEKSENPVKSTSVYKIAETLYNGSMMDSEITHNYLYDNVLNIVTIKNNRAGIANNLLSELKVSSYSDPNYKLINTLYRDLYAYISFGGVYAQGVSSYTQRGTFVAKTMADDNETVDAALCNELNQALTKTYQNVSEWISENGYFYTPKAYSPSKTGSTVDDAGTNI